MRCNKPKVCWENVTLVNVSGLVVFFRIFKQLQPSFKHLWSHLETTLKHFWHTWKFPEKALLETHPLRKKAWIFLESHYKHPWSFLLLLFKIPKGKTTQFWTLPKTPRPPPPGWYGSKKFGCSEPLDLSHPPPSPHRSLDILIQKLWNYKINF